MKKLIGESRKYISIKLLNKCKTKNIKFCFRNHAAFLSQIRISMQYTKSSCISVYLYIMVVGLYYYVIFHAVHKTKQLQQHTREMFLTEKKERKKRSCATYCTYILAPLCRWDFLLLQYKKNLVFKTIKMFL